MERMFYLAELIGSLDKVCTMLAVVFFIAMVVGWVGRALSNSCRDEYTDEVRKIFKLLSRYTTILGIVFILGAVLLPSKKTYLLMMGGKVVDMTIEDNSQIKKIPGKTIDLLNAWIEEETKSLSEKNEQGDK